MISDLTVDKAWTNGGKTNLERGKTHPERGKMYLERGRGYQEFRFVSCFFSCKKK